MRLTRLIVKTLTISVMLFTAQHVLAEGNAEGNKTADALPIQIHSTKQNLDIPNHITIFTGDVVVTRGDMKIEADKVTITQPDGQRGQEVMEAFGNPVRFYAILEDGKPVRGHSQQLRYDMAHDQVTLTTDAFLEQQDNNIHGQQITYLVKEQQMTATGNKQSRVKTTFIPAQVSNNK